MSQDTVWYNPDMDALGVLYVTGDFYFGIDGSFSIDNIYAWELDEWKWILVGEL